MIWGKAATVGVEQKVARQRTRDSTGIYCSKHLRKLRKPKSLNGAGYVREDSIGVASDQANCADHNYQNHRNHHGILGNILTVVFEYQNA